ncbi:plant UBX domain-containing protein 10-like, partial [Asparagus officinalis]|uniref:plant UBX domain-containing protein 10-like n=1 Tax=Asparagus officinalis TaxID=4686 RepID=UPI00098E6B45
MADRGGGSAEDKIAYFQAITGLDDRDLSTEILAAHDWDLDQAVSTFTSNPSPNPTDSNNFPAASTSNPSDRQRALPEPQPYTSLPRRRPLAFWIARTSSHPLSSSRPHSSKRRPQDRLALSSSCPKLAAFVSAFEREFSSSEGSTRPNFVAEGFMDALQRSQREFKLMFVYLHSPDHPDVPEFCLRCLCAVPVAEFVNENFVAWG